VRKILKRLKAGTPKAAITKSAKTDHTSDTNGAQRVSLRPEQGWSRRNFVTEVLIPSLFERRRGHATPPPRLPKPQSEQIGLVWIGHASFLIQTQSSNLLIDPNWARWLKVLKRIRHPGVQLRDLPPIDVVLVTHAHFDHLDRRTLRSVAAGQPIVVPFEVGNLVHDLGFKTVHELGYWESFLHRGKAGDDIRVTLTPCHHWGARALVDRHRGFGGFVVQTGGRTIYHCGDTAYFPGFREIGKQFEIDVALLPIGAYDAPSKREVHMNPEQAIQAFHDLNARMMVPMHYGTFRLSYEPLHEPLERLRAEAARHGLGDRVRILEEGEPLIV
jgi:L-ascorbate metabolism protein UlaG (beta-lactamase superfamily)